MIRKSESLVTGAQGHQPGQTCSQEGSQAGGRGLSRSSEEGSGRSRWRWSPGHKRKIRKQSLTVSPAGPEGLGSQEGEEETWGEVLRTSGQREGLTTAQFGVEDQNSFSHLDACPRPQRGCSWGWEWGIFASIPEMLRVVKALPSRA